jgi:hypothetical protein
MAIDLKHISPELALVDPELAAVARLHLPEPGSFGRRPEGPAEVGPPPRVESRRRVSQPFVLFVLVLIVASALFIGRAMSSVPRPWLSETANPGVAVQTITWRPVSDATYYDLVVWRDGRRVFDMWPTAAAADVPLNARSSGGSGLEAGHYLWFAYPGFGARAANQYGPLVGSGALVVRTRGKSDVKDASTAHRGPRAAHARSGGG